MPVIMLNCLVMTFLCVCCVFSSQWCNDNRQESVQLLFDLNYPQLEQAFASVGTREMHLCSARHVATLGMASALVSFLMGHWGSVWSGKRMQDGTWPQCATALSTVSTEEKFSYVCIVGVNSHFKVLVFLCWAAWIRHLFMSRCIDYVLMVGSFWLCF